MIPPQPSWFLNKYNERNIQNDFPKLSEFEPGYPPFHTAYQCAISHSARFESINLSDTRLSFPSALFTSPIDTRKIFRDSERFHGLDIRKVTKEARAKSGNTSEVRRNTEAQSEGTLKQRFHRALSKAAQASIVKNRFHVTNSNTEQLVRGFFPFDNDTLYLAKRKSGLKDCLSIYFRELKKHQPYLYQVCLTSAQKLLADKELTRSPKGFCSISVHQSETNLPNLLEQINKQKFPKKTCPIFFL